MADSGMYVGIALGSSVMLGVCVGILYRKHQQDLKELRQQEQVIRDRFQHVAANNLPPFYIDHELDPVAIYEHELPPDVVPVSDPILVQSTSEDIIPPEEDPLVSSPPFIRGLSTPRMPSLSQSDSHMSTGSPQASPVSAPRQDSLSEPIESFTQTFELPSPISILPTAPEAVLLSPVGLPPIAPITHEELMTLAQLPPPPSYDIPNRIVDQSPMMELSGFNFGPTLSSSTTTYLERALTPSTLSNDHFTHRARSHTFSHPSSAHHRPHLHQHHHHHHSESHIQVQREENLPQTPRYSLEFPSHIPHELHLQQHQQARASSFMVPSPSSSSSTAFSTPRMDTQSPHMLQSRSFSQPWHYPASSLSSESLENGPRARQRPAGSRGRSSTLGESSKLLIQRMQSLWRKTGASSAMPSSAALAVFNDVPQGLGLSLENDDSTASSSSSRQQHVEDVVVVVVPQEEEEEEDEVVVASSSASTLSPEIEDEEEDKESTMSEEEALRASSSTNISSALSLESRMSMPMTVPLAVS